MTRWLLLSTVFASLALSACSRAGAGTAAASTPPPQTAAFDGAGLLQSACTTCHDLSAITSNPGAYTEADFRDTVQRMIGYGAVISQNQVEPLVAYLVETYGD